ncbi:hypothetical protein ACFYYB_20380 [Streptomyces sp. NPDC002886]
MPPFHMTESGVRTIRLRADPDIAGRAAAAWAMAAAALTAASTPAATAA